MGENMELGLFNNPAWIKDGPNVQDIVNSYLEVSL